MYCKCHKISFNPGGSYIDSPDGIRDKAIINPINKKDNKCFQYTVTVSLNYEEKWKYAGRITKIKPFINKHKWAGIKFPSEKDDWKIFDKNNAAIALNILYAKKAKIYPAYVSKHNSNRYFIILKASYSINNFKWRERHSYVQRTMVLFCSQKTISITKRNNF